jgi:nitrile hydratase accessory protein
VSQRLSGPVAESIEAMTDVCAVPRDNGEFIFDEPWQGRAFAMAVILVERLGLPWSAFQERLIAAIASDDHQPYYDSWASALESLVVEYGLVESHDVDREADRSRLAAGSDHPFTHQE